MQSCQGGALQYEQRNRLFDSSFAENDGYSHATAGLAKDCRVSLRWHFLLWLSDFKTKTSFEFLINKIRSLFLICPKDRKVSSFG